MKRLEILTPWRKVGMHLRPDPCLRCNLSSQLVRRRVSLRGELHFEEKCNHCGNVTRKAAEPEPLRRETRG